MQLDTIICSDALAYLKTLPDNSVDCCVSSIPYFGLRDYQTGHWEGGNTHCQHDRGGKPQAPQTKHPNAASSIVSGGNREAGDHCVKCGAMRVDGQIGLESTPQEFIARIVAVYEEVRRVLKPTGTCWLNVGDTYASPWSSGRRNIIGNGSRDNRINRVGDGFKEKDKMLMPARIAIALCDAGWYVRSEIIWAKPATMPSSAEDRPTDSHEMVYLLTKAPHYWSDFTAIREPAKLESQERLSRARGGNTKPLRIPGQKPHGMHKPKGNDRRNGKNESLGKRQYDGFNDRWDNRAEPLLTRNIRDVWTINPEPSRYRYCGHCDRLFVGPRLRDILYREVDGKELAFCPKCNQSDGWVDHFAAFPQKLVERCILAGCPTQVCSTCGKPWERLTEKQFTAQMDVSPERGMKDAPGLKPMDKSNGWQKFPRGSTSVKTVGWCPTCNCGNPDLRPDDLELIETPTGERAGDDPSRLTGRAGYNRPRGDSEGKRPITRYEQRHYAEQLRQSSHREQMESEAGSAFAHYIRTDKAGARPIPGDLLERWIDCKWLDRVRVPELTAVSSRPGVVLDPFMGSGTTALVSRRLGRHYIGCDLGQKYVNLANSRLGEAFTLPLFADL